MGFLGIRDVWLGGEKGSAAVLLFPVTSFLYQQLSVRGHLAGPATEIAA